MNHTIAFIHFGTFLYRERSDGMPFYKYKQNESGLVQFECGERIPGQSTSSSMKLNLQQIPKTICVNNKHIEAAIRHACVLISQ